MSRTSVHPSAENSPITSQPQSRGSSKEGSENNSAMELENGDDIRMPTPRNCITPPDCPPGLGCLVDLEYVFLKRSYHSVEGMGIEGHPETSTKYEVLTVYGHRIFVVVETKGAIMSKMFCAAGVPFSLIVYSKSNETQFKKEALQIEGHPGGFGRPGNIEIKFGKKKMGRVDQDADFTKMRYTIQNADGKTVLKILGPKSGHCCSMTMANVLTHEFDVFQGDGLTHVGRIAKHWSGVPNNKDVFTRSDIWGVKFPREYDVKLKASLMSTIFLMWSDYPK
ncbi:unnamed protein product [Allacma fusca]|uniref:Phospholipid scramblase n=1 Tax=Allacma fusca TaxID=39272 RepID=A0A8J2PJT4_9HEXA|nr:unnamed protein product [Allacma fusca]